MCMTDRKVFSEILETLHRGRIKPAEQHAPGKTAARAKLKGGAENSSKDTTAHVKAAKPGPKGREKPKSCAVVNKPGKNLECGDLEQRYGKLNLISVRPTDHTCPAVPPEYSPQASLTSDACSPMQIQVSRFLSRRAHSSLCIGGRHPDITLRRIN